MHYLSALVIAGNTLWLATWFMFIRHLKSCRLTSDNIPKCTEKFSTVQHFCVWVVKESTDCHSMQSFLTKVWQYMDGESIIQNAYKCRQYHLWYDLGHKVNKQTYLFGGLVVRMLCITAECLWV